MNGLRICGGGGGKASRLTESIELLGWDRSVGVLLLLENLNHLRLH